MPMRSVPTVPFELDMIYNVPIYDLYTTDMQGIDLPKGVSCSNWIVYPNGLELAYNVDGKQTQLEGTIKWFPLYQSIEVYFPDDLTISRSVVGTDNETYLLTFDCK